MLEVLKRLVSPEYLVVARPGPMGNLWVLYAVLGLIFGVGMAIALRIIAGRTTRSEQADRAPAVTPYWAWFALWICLAGLVTVIGRFLGWPGWSARIWPYSLAALTVLGAFAYRLRHWQVPRWLYAQIHVLSLSPSSPAADGPRQPGRRTAWFLAGLGVHLFGTALVLGSRYGWPIWTAPPVLAVLLLPQTPLLARRRWPSIMALSPLLVVYATTILWLLYRWLGITIIGWQGLAFPDPMVSLFYVDGIVLAGASYSILCQLSITLSYFGRRDRLWQWVVTGLLVITLAWAVTVYLGKRTHGATASDPYAYAQMGVDLATRGTFLHRFSLFEQVIPLHIAWAPLQPVGYHVPRNGLGDSPSVWATGSSVLLAAGYKMLGETGLYVTTPIVALLALAATWALVHETLHKTARPTRYLVGALTVGLLATSPEYVDRILVPMADASAQLFTVLTLLFTLRALHRRSWTSSRWEWALAGLCFGWAYWVRHTQFVLAIPILLAMWMAGQGQSRQAATRMRILEGIGRMALFFGAALVAALPDILYRWRVFGGPLATETTELHAMALLNVGPMAWQTVRDTLVAGEWGYLFPLALFGAYRLARDHRRETLVLGSAFGAVLFVHLTYRFLRLRDLISLFPLVDLAVGYGAVTLVRRVRLATRRGTETRQFGPSLLSVTVVAWIILCLASARWPMLDNLWKRGWASFGYMRPENRAAFDRIAELTPTDAVVGASLNAGAVMMYAGRDAIRPYDSWTDIEWNTFLEEMRHLGRPVYLLDDGGLMATFIDKVKDYRRLVPIQELEIPLFYTQDREKGWLYRLEWDR